MSHDVRLEVFEGPIDLLLHLITKQRVDIYDVSISTITEEYVDAVVRMEVIDLDAATAFLVVAATLLELKSMRLLPAPSADGADAVLEERDLLLARLVEAATYREAGGWIARRLEAHAWFVGRTAGLEPRFVDVAPDLLADTAIADVAAAAARALAPKPQVVLDTSHVAPIAASVRDALVELSGRLENEEEASFERLCGGVERMDVIVRFLALLELFKAGAVELAQAERFGDIRARWTGRVPVEIVLDDVEEYALEEGAA